MAEKSVSQFNVLAALSGQRTDEQTREEFLWPGLGRTAVGMLAGQDGVGKTYYGLLAGAAVACSDPRADLLGINPQTHGKVMHFVYEDSRETAFERLAAIGKLIPASCHQDIHDNLTLEFPNPDEENWDLRRPDHVARMITKTKGYTLVFADTMNDFHCADANSNSEMLDFMKGCTRISNANNLAWMNVHYPSKQSIRDQEDSSVAVSGALPLSSKSRYLTIMREMTRAESLELSCTPDGAPIHDFKRFVFVSIPKASRGCDVGNKWFQRNEKGVLLPVDLTPAGKRAGKQNLQIVHPKNNGPKRSAKDFPDQSKNNGSKKDAQQPPKDWR